MYISREKATKLGLLAGIITLCVAIVFVILNGINQFKLGSQLASENQVSNLSHILVQQQAKMFSSLLVKNAKTDELADALDSFAKEEFVLDANLYSATGELLAQSQNAKRLKELLASENDPQSSQQITQQIVEPVFFKQTLVGFLRVTFDAQYGQTTKHRVEQKFHLLYGQLIILVLVGILSASSIHYFLRKKGFSVYTTTKQANVMPSKTQTQRFHSRRRVFSRK